MRKIYLLLLLLSLMASNLRAQNLMEFRFKAFNWGAKVDSMPHSRLSIQ